MRTLYIVLVLLLTLGVAGNSYAQSGIVGTPGQVSLGDVVDLRSQEVDFMPQMRNINKVHTPGMNAEKDAFFAEKARLAKALNDLPPLPESGTRSDAPTPLALSGFQANEQQNRPNDNDLAMSEVNGQIVSVSNSMIRVYDPNGQELRRRSLRALGGAVVNSGIVFDPRALYDKYNDRFIVVFDNGSSPNANQIVICFSQTGDATGQWNAYAVNGNLRPSGTQVWTDYPAVAMTRDELFITGNLFDGGGNSPGVGIWQCEIADGYAGNPLDFVSYVDQRLFGLAPVEGADDIYGPEMHFILRSGPSGRGFALFQVTNTINSGQARFESVGTFSGQDNYGIPPNARQPGSTAIDGSDRLATNDGRILHAVRMNDNIYWVQGSNVGGRPGIYLGKISFSPLGPNFYSIETTTIASSELDLGFPSITFAGQSCVDGNRTKEDLFIGFNFASPSKFPGIGCYYVSVDMDVSDPVIGVEGQGNLFLTGDADDPRNRWGDYSDITYRGNPGEAFMVGYYADAGGRHDTWVSQFFVTPPACNTSLAYEIPPVQELKAYPNPAVELIKFEFRVEEAGIYHSYITDMQGRKLQTVIKDQLWPGKVGLSFNTAALSAGRYQVVVEGPQGRIMAKPFVVMQ